MRSIALALAACLLLIAPAGHTGEIKSPDFTATDLQDKALVLLSTSADRTSRVATMHLMLVRVEEKKGKRKLKSLGILNVNNGYTTSHSPNAHLHVHWRALEPGEYFLKRTLTSPIACFDVRVTFHFTLTAGTRVYLGEFALQSGEIGVRDSYQRDYDYFVANSKGEHPAVFAPSPPEKRVGDDFECRPMSPY